MSDKVLITGGLGYIGGRISKFLAKQGDFFLSLGTRQAGCARPDWLRRGDIIQHDLMSADSLTFACKGVKYIIHLAALNEIDSAANPEQALLINGYGTLKLLRAAENAGVERFIYFSTAHVYSAPLQGVITEKIVPKPVHPYAISHKTAEDFVLAAHAQKVVIGIVLRLSNSFGAPMNPSVNRWTLLVNDLCRQAVTTRKLVLKSSGSQKRDFIPISDVERAVYHFLNLSVDKCGDGLFNLGGELTLRIIDMARLIAERCHETLGFKPEIVSQKNSEPEISHSLDYRIDKIKCTGFELKGNTNAEIDSTLLFCRDMFC